MTMPVVHHDLGSLLEHIRDRTGLVFPNSRREAAEASLRRIMRGCGITDSDRFCEYLDSDPRIFDAVAAALTVGETYFFRDPAQFEVIRRLVLPDIRSRKPPGAPLWFWSAGCATGEEPYTLAMLAEEEGLGADARILGTDLSRAALERAKAGIYGAWSFRNDEAKRRKGHFVKEAQHYVLHERIRHRVRFAFLNLAADGFPSPHTGTVALDLILCRNVLIYFAREDVERIAHRLFDCLVDGGWLVTGASDPPLRHYAPFETILTDGGVIYRRDGDRNAAQRPLPVAARLPQGLRTQTADGMVRPLVVPAEQFSRMGAGLARSREAHGAAKPAPKPWTRTAQPSVPAVPMQEIPVQAKGSEASTEEQLELMRRRFADGDYEGVTGLASTLPESAEASVLNIKALMNLGRSAEAAARAAVACAAHPLDAACHYLQAILWISEGRREDAVEALRRVIYLDRSLAVAHLTLASLYRDDGDWAAAQRAYERAYQLCAGRPGDEAVPLAEGETAARLAAWARRAAQQCEQSQRRAAV